MEEILIANNLNPKNITKNLSNEYFEAGVINCLISEKNDVHFEFFEFDNISSPIRVYRQVYNDNLSENKLPQNVSIETGGIGYRYYSLTTKDRFLVTVYVENTALYAYCNNENSAELVEIISDMGYVEVKEQSETPKIVEQFFIVIPYLLLTLFVVICRNGFYWKAVIKSSGIREKELEEEIEKENGKRACITHWILENSKNYKLTKILIYVYKLMHIPIFIGLLFVVFSCFTGGFSGIIKGKLWFIEFFYLAIMWLIGSEVLKRVEK